MTRVCNNAVNDTFHKTLLSTVNSNILTDLNFEYSDEDNFNRNVSGICGSVEISVFHLNVRSLNKNHNNLYNFVNNLELSFDVLVVSEIWNLNLTLYRNLFPGYTFHWDSCAASEVGGVGVFIRNSLVYSSIDSLKIISTDGNLVENLWFEIKSEKQKYILGAVYRHPNQNIDEFTKLLDDKLSAISKASIPCIIAGDININLCNYSVHKPTMEYVNNLLINNFIPVIVMPTRITDQSATIIDHVYYYEGKNCKRDLNIMSGNLWCDMSDHLPNYLIINDKKVNNESKDRPLIRIYSEQNIQKFKNMISHTTWDNIYCCQDVNKAYELFETKIAACFNKCFPLVRLSRRCARDKRWVTKGIKISSKRKNKLYKKWRTTNNDVDRLKYTTYKRIYNKMLMEAEESYYREHFDAKLNTIKQLWTNLNHMFSLSKTKTSTKISELIVNDTKVTEPQEICNQLNRHFSSVGEKLASNIKSGSNDYSKYCDKKISKSMFCEAVTSSEIYIIVSKFKNNKSPGPDNIGPKLLKYIIELIIEPLVYIYNLSFSSGEVPQSLKIAKVIPLYKKGEKTNPGNYRPISLLSIFDKILEKLMYKRLYSFLHKHSVLYQFQFGFRRYHSTTLALIELTDSLYTHLDNHDSIIGMYFDLQKAFDTVDHSILLQKLHNYGIRGSVHTWFRDYLSNRRQFVSIGNNASDFDIITYGVPQGSVLGPLLFLIYVNDICNVSPDCNVKLFADDTNVFVFGNCIDDVFSNANIVASQLDDGF